MMKHQLVVLGFIFMLLQGCNLSDRPAMVKHYESFSSQYVDARHVDVWLPAGYDSTGNQRYSVLYMHDGQNLFDTATSYGGNEWMVDEMVSSLMGEGRIDSCIVVGIWNSPKRFFEYAPQAPFNLLPDSAKVLARAEFQGDSTPLSDAYLRFVVEELKPFIDASFKTRPDRGHTFVMGSSMGGLISLYALAEYPGVFGGAGCLSTHWPFSLRSNSPAFTKAVILYLAPRLESMRESKIYFDYGTATIDAWYEPHQKMIDSLFLAHGFNDSNYLSLRFEGADHNEAAWAVRLDKPLVFLLGK